MLGRAEACPGHFAGCAHASLLMNEGIRRRLSGKDDGVNGKELSTVVARSSKIWREVVFVVELVSDMSENEVGILAS